MKSPIAPVQTPIDSNIPANWRAYFTQLQSYLSHLPSAGVALSEYADDTAAEAGGVTIYGYYRTGSVVKQRVV